MADSVNTEENAIVKDHVSLGAMEEYRHDRRQEQADAEHQARRPEDIVVLEHPAPDPPAPGRQRLAWWLVGCLVVSHLGLVVHGAINDSQTFDEGVHLAAGVSYWVTGDFRLNPEHPVLWKLVAAAPVLLLRPDVPLDHPAWAGHRAWEFADIFLDANRVPVGQLLLVGRLAGFLAGSLLIIVVFRFGTELFGLAAGLAAASLTAFDPNLIAHARLITTDLPITLAITTTLYLLWRYRQHPTRQRLAWVILGFVFASLVKYSGLLLLILLPLELAVARRDRSVPLTPHRLFGLLLVSLLVSLLVVYRGGFRKLADDPRLTEIYRQRQSIIEQQAVAEQPVLIQRLIGVTEPGQPVQTAIERFSELPLPFYWYLRGTAAVVSHSYWGQPAYLFGQTNERGWWWYFPAAFLVKTPLATLGLITVALAALARRRLARPQPLPTTLAFILVPVGLYVLATFFTRLNLGIRHLLPIYPLLFLVVGWLTSLRHRRFPRLFRGLVLTLVAGLPFSTGLSHPGELGYFSEAVGGWQRGHRYLLDSNLDWGQDLRRLRHWMTSHRVDRIFLAYAGTARPTAYGVEADALPLDPPAGQGPNRYAVISIGRLVGESDRYGWLASYPLVARIGTSLLVYDLAPAKPLD